MYLLDRLEHWAVQTPDATAVVFGDENFSFRQLRERACEVRSVLAGQFGIRKSDRVAYLGLNHPDMLALLFACADLGAIFEPMNSRLARDEYNYLLSDSEPKICLFDDNFSSMVDELAPGDFTMVPLTDLKNSEQSANSAIAQTLLKGLSDDPLLLVYTSGTTGRPKGVLLSQQAVETNISNCQTLYNFESGQKVQVTLPLFHVGGLCILLLPALTHGATIHLHAKFDPVAALAEIETESITTSIFVPAQMAAMMTLPDWNERDLSSMDYVVVGSSLIPMEQIKRFHARGIPVSQVYGATETGPAAIGLEIGSAMEHEGSAGTPVKHCDIEIRDMDGGICGPEYSGEIWVRGANILSGYWRSEEETTKVLVDGWYKTGDIGKVDGQGFYWIVDRSKDVIISGGENIYPAEVEAVASQHPAIAAIAVIGRPDPHWGETPVAAVELEDGHSLELEDLRAFLDGKLARYKYPKSLVRFNTLPRNGLGKIEKAALRKKVTN